MRFVRLLLASAVLGAAVAVLCVALGAVGAGASGPGAPSCSVTVTGSPTLVSGAEQLGWEDDGTPGDPLSVSLVGGVTGGDVVCSGVPAWIRHSSLRCPMWLMVGTGVWLRVRVLFLTGPRVRIRRWCRHLMLGRLWDRGGVWCRVSWVSLGCCGFRCGVLRVWGGYSSVAVVSVRYGRLVVGWVR